MTTRENPLLQPSKSGASEDLSVTVRWRLTYVADPSDMQVSWGSCADPRGVLVVGETYDVDHIEMHSWHTKVFLAGIDCGRGFNSVSFEEPS